MRREPGTDCQSNGGDHGDDEPTAHAASEDEVPERPILGWVQILVHALERGQCEIRVRWPDDSRGEDAEGAARRQRFAEFVIAELEADLADT